LERLKLTPRRPNVGPAVRAASPVPTAPKLTFAEKQLLQALLQGRDIGEALEPFLASDLGARVWSRPVLQQLTMDSDRNIEAVLAHVDDEALKQEIRAAAMEPFGPISTEQALDSVKRLYDVQLVQKLEEIRLQLRQYEPGPAPRELVQKHMEIVAERNRVAAIKA